MQSLLSGSRVTASGSATSHAPMGVWLRVNRTRRRLARARLWSYSGQSRAARVSRVETCMLKSSPSIPLGGGEGARVGSNI